MNRGRREIKELQALNGAEVVDGKKHVKVYVKGKLVMVLSHGARNRDKGRLQANHRMRLRKLLREQEPEPKKEG